MVIAILIGAKGAMVKVKVKFSKVDIMQRFEKEAVFPRYAARVV